MCLLGLRFFCGCLYLWLRLSLVQILYFKGFCCFSMEPLPWPFSILGENSPVQLDIPVDWLLSHLVCKFKRVHEPLRVRGRVFPSVVLRSQGVNALLRY